MSQTVQTILKLPPDGPVVHVIIFQSMLTVQRIDISILNVRFNCIRIPLFRAFSDFQLSFQSIATNSDVTIRCIYLALVSSYLTRTSLLYPMHLSQFSSMFLTSPEECCDHLLSQHSVQFVFAIVQSHLRTWLDDDVGVAWSEVRNRSMMSENELHVLAVVPTRRLWIWKVRCKRIATSVCPNQSIPEVECHFRTSSQ